MMTKQEFEACLEKHADEIERIRQSAHELHRSVNQTYGDGLPYSYHLDMVVSNVREFGHLVCASEEDVLPLIFGGYYHDSIEDARQTYNDVMRTALRWMTGEKYYKGIRETLYAPFVKMCDRLANITFSCSNLDGVDNDRMKKVYKAEVPHFLSSINSHSDDPRRALPKEMVVRLAECLIDDLEKEERDNWVWQQVNG